MLDNWAAAGGKPPAAAPESQHGSQPSCKLHSNLNNDHEGARKREGCQPTTKRAAKAAKEVGKRGEKGAMAGLEGGRAVQTR